MIAIHQLIAGFSNGDAISNEARVLRDLFRSWGHPSEIFCEAKRILPNLRKEARDVATCRAAMRPDDVALLHLSIGSLVNDLFATLPGRKAILYHNITPAHYLRGLQEAIAADLERGREQLPRLAGKANVVMADSAYNARELEELGYGPVRVLPLVLDLARLRAAPSRSVLKEYGDGTVNVLCVGRCVPNKRLEDVLRAFHIFQNYVEPDSRLLFAGSYDGLEHYRDLLMTLVREWRLDNVRFLGSVPQETLNALYRTAHVFLCMSEHEGFCIPLIECLAHDVPVLAYASTAVPGTLDGAGVLFREKKFEHVAEMMGCLVKDTRLREAVVRGQRERLARYEQRDLASELRQHLSPLL